MIRVGEDCRIVQFVERGLLYRRVKGLGGESDVALFQLLDGDVEGDGGRRDGNGWRRNLSWGGRDLFHCAGSVC